MKRILLAIVAAALPCFPAASATPLCDYVSYMVRDGRCIDISEGSWRGAYGRYVADFNAQAHPIVVQNLSARATTGYKGAFQYSTITGQFLNQSRRAVSGASATIAIYRGDQLMGTVNVRVDHRIEPGAVASFEEMSFQPGSRLVAESIDPP